MKKAYEKSAWRKTNLSPLFLDKKKKERFQKVILFIGSR